jgi:hypothetical protein
MNETVALATSLEESRQKFGRNMGYRQLNVHSCNLTASFLFWVYLKTRNRRL